MRGLRAAILAVLLTAGGQPAPAQEAIAEPVASPVLTLDQERLFAESLWGRRATDRIEAASTELGAENRRIEAELTAEERALTERRPTMAVEEFRAAADAFDAKVTEIRRTQDAKAREIGRLHDVERQRFFAAAFPALREVLRGRGAVVILDSRAIFLAADVIDVTDELIARVDADLGAGTDAPVPEAVPDAPGSDGTAQGGN
ncbi:OmpH family outer membrane protein [Defluviimonas sp. D31]|uniref:OmpH family outer membrane protein n=1 Tax=Defluviimonas sp. D31 TaxID=3083253 RepID=UPI00296E3B9B|nr:OmpH family outer membrane protein [Defluviimonas sp. D31]MDW4548761.1 OmpH family outer membrane protein [Defluviimonas sp. D31]